jgi:hypothetical protein
MSNKAVSNLRQSLAARFRVILQDWATQEEIDPAGNEALAEFLATVGAEGATADYLATITAATLRRPANVVDTKQAILDALDRLLAALHETVVPAELSTLATTIAAYAQSRLDETHAARLAGAMIARHVLAPRLRVLAGAADAALAAVVSMALAEIADGTPFGAQPGSRLVALQPDFARLAEAFDEWVRELVMAGAFAMSISARLPGADADDMWTQAEVIIANDRALASAFMLPTPDDPLGTRPRYLLTAIGQALDVARRARSTDYDWVAVQRLADTNPGEFAALLRDERLHVVDNLSP